MQSFPQPLSAIEENEYIKRWEQGDTKARQVLIEKNLRLVAYLVKKYSGIEHSIDDCISVGTIGLIKAIDSYSSDKGVRLATYASRCIENELLMMLRGDKKQSKDVFLYEPIGDEDSEGNQIRLLDILESEEIDVVSKVTTEKRLELLPGFMKKCLTKREYEILVLRFGIGGNKEHTQRELAKKYGISRSYVSRIQKRALKKLRKCYEKSET